MKIRTTALAGLVGLVTLAGPAMADRDDDRYEGRPITLTHAEAIDIARANGVVEVRETRARRGLWKVEGWNADGDKIEIRMDGQSGAVVEVEIYGPFGEHHRDGYDD